MRNTDTALLAACMALLLAGCHSDGPRADILPRDMAVNDHRAMRMEILKIFDNSNNDYTNEFKVWHIIEVKVLEGPPDYKGKIMDLPYDDYYASKPPLIGDVVVAAPADWVSESAPGKTRGIDR